MNRTVWSLILFVPLFFGIITSTADETESIAEPLVLNRYADWIQGTQGKPLIAYVRQTVERSIRQIALENEDLRYPWIERPVGVFVTAMKGRKVRSCVGTLTPGSMTLQRELIRQCRRLVAGDLRHSPLQASELDQIKFVVTFTGVPNPIDDPDRVDLWREGLMASWNGRQAILLPGEAKTLSWGLNELRRQIQIPDDETPRYASFPVVVLAESADKNPSRLPNR